MHAGEHGNEFEARRWLKTHYDPATTITELGYKARLIQRGNVQDTRHLQSTMERREDFRRQRDNSGHPPPEH